MNTTHRNDKAKTVHVRLAELQDAPSLKMCIDNAYAPHKSRLPDLPNVSSGIEDDISNNSVYVIDENGTVIGGAVLLMDGNAALLANVAIDPAHKGKGLGRLLIEYVENDALRRNAMEIRLTTHIGMPDNVALYKHLGWRERGRDGNKVKMAKALRAEGDPAA